MAKKKDINTALEEVRDLNICPSCSRLLNTEYSTSLSSVDTSAQYFLTQVYNRDETNDISAQSLDPTRRPEITPTRYSTKLTAVANNLATSGKESKSIVFSSWRAPLEIIAEILQEKQIKFLKIDGSVGNAKRSDRLAQFRTLADVSVLLMTLQTGAVGLNLTEANYVHIIEPQWNPQVEEQAIGRALRLGQSREVTVIRYVMENTVEKRIIELQNRKNNLAKYAFQVGNGESIQSEKLLELKFILQLS